MKRFKNRGDVLIFRCVSDSASKGVLSLFFFIYLPSNIKAYTAYKSGQDRKAARAALITALNTSKTHVV